MVLTCLRPLAKAYILDCLNDTQASGVHSPRGTHAYRLCAREVKLTRVKSALRA